MTKIQTRQVPEQFITLPYPAKEYKHLPQSNYPAGEVEITVRKLEELAEHTSNCDRYFDSAFINLGSRAEDALEAKGWATEATRGGVWGTEKFMEWMSKKNLY